MELLFASPPRGFEDIDPCRGQYLETLAARADEHEVMLHDLAKRISDGIDARLANTCCPFSGAIFLRLPLDTPEEVHAVKVFLTCKAGRDLAKALEKAGWCHVRLHLELLGSWNKANFAVDLQA